MDSVTGHMAATSAELFPPSPRVIYNKAPLIQVICQLRFPLLLSIESAPPVEFQERIRDHFPLLEKAANPLPADLPQKVVEMIRAQTSAVTYQFLTEDRASTVTLTPSSLALTADKYTQWEHFRDSLRVPLTALIEIYKPSFFSRIGLRYQDAIDRIELGLEGIAWSKLLRREVLGELVLPQFEANLDKVANRTLRLKLPNGQGSVQLQHGLGDIPDRKDLCYMIDIDFFTENRTEVSDAESALNHYNSIAGHAFRWCISGTLRDALEPRELAAASS